MSLTLEQCITRVKEVYPGMEPVYWIPYYGKYIFNIVSVGQDSRSAIIDFHMVDPETGGVSGSIPLDMVTGNSEIVSLLKKPNKISQQNSSLEHQIKKKPLDNGHYYAVVRTGSSLTHHGIMGQKWGVRRYQNEDGSLTDAGRERYGRDSKTKKLPDNPKGMDPVLAYYAAEAAAMAAFCIGTSIYVKVKKNQNHKNAKKENDALSEDYISDISELKEFSDDNKPKSIVGAHSIEADLAAVNPKYGQEIKGNANNCVLCSMTYDLRRRGFDVTAKMCTSGMYTEKVLKELYDGAKLEKTGGMNWSSVIKKCEKKYPEGSRGVIDVSCDFGGHSMIFEIHNGKLEIYDSQCNTRRKLTDSELSIFNPQYTETARLDDKAVKWSGASIVCAELKSDWKKTIASQKKRITSQESETRSDRKIAAGIRTAMNAKQILAYRKEHPNTKLTDKEIWKNIIGG